MRVADAGKKKFKHKGLPEFKPRHVGHKQPGEILHVNESPTKNYKKDKPQK